MPMEAFLSILIAMLFGAIIGVERESANKPAGLRTNMLVSGAVQPGIGRSWLL
jgi:putative Mg2+ transporter-C (MgtC) family protein